MRACHWILGISRRSAAALGISPLTVRTHLEHIFEKLRVSTRTAAVARFRQLCAGTADRDT